ncbi:MAG TPA: efflux RND transporter periplasmic adaptor subunit [Dongiaceae bacterium]|nr:efflux RND transporter periplasmic adaptor subunit [Dongiaceae bacterium]
MGKGMAAFLAAMTLGLGAGAAAAEEFVVAVRQIADLKAVFATVESVDVTPARTRIGGTIEALAVDEGSRVELGQRLAVVGDPKLPLQLAALDARIRSLRAQRDLASVELDRYRKLRQTGAASQARLDEAQTALDVVDSGLAAMIAERAVVAEQLAEGAVLAPAAGRLLQVNVVDGAVVMPGETVATIAADNYVLRMRLPERHARFIGEGDRVLVGSRGLETAPRDLAEGRVRQVYPEMEQGRVVADIAVAGIGDYFVGERARVFVSTGERPAFVVPAAYLYRRFGVDYALVKDVGETVVQTGLPVEDGVEVLSGLRPGDVLLPPPAGPVP